MLFDVRGVEGVKHCTVIPIKDQKAIMSEVSKVVFVAFTQHCIQSTVTHVRGVKGYCTLYTVASHPCQEGRLLCEPSILGV